MTPNTISYNVSDNFIYKITNIIVKNQNVNNKSF